ncbi:MAG: translocation/assembly module TamB domain-containing protein [Prevotella sp.]|nr:translocation/assembly module TamB domain-containing protein [Prevotella sp.]
MSKYLKWGGIAILIPVLLIALLFALFYFPPFQRWAVRQVAAYASEEMNMEISVGHVHLAFPLDLSMQEVKVLQPNDSPLNKKDTVAYIGDVCADVQLFPLLKKQVMIDELSFNQMTVNTAHFIPSARIRGKVGHLDLQAHGIDLGNQLVNVDNATLDNAKLSIELSDTVPPDTTPSTNFWKIKLANLKVRNTDFTLHMPGDTLSVNAYLGKASARYGYFDLGKGLYQVSHLNWDDGRMKYDQNFVSKCKGLDYNHLALDKLTLKADSFSFGNAITSVIIREGAFKEQSGLTVDKLQGRFYMDSTRLAFPSLMVNTEAGTKLGLNFQMDNTAFDEIAPGKFSVSLKGQVGKQDLMTFIGSKLPSQLRKQWPNKPLILIGDVRGNMQKSRIKINVLSIPGVIKLKADGFAENLLDMNKLKANVDVNTKAQNLSFVSALFDRSIRKTFNIPNEIGFDGNVKVSGNEYASTFTATQGGGNLRGHVAFDANKMAYNAQLTANSLPLQNFLPHQNLHPFTGSIEAKGEGVDFLSPNTRLMAKARINKFNYGEYNLNDIDATATIRNGHIVADVDSRNPLLQGKFTIDALTGGKNVRATLTGDLHRVDLYNLRFTEQPLVISMCTHVDVSTDLKQTHQVRGTLSDITILNNEKYYQPENIDIDMLTSRDTTHAMVYSSDFQLNMDVSGGYEQLLKSGQKFVAEMQSQYKNKYIDQIRLRKQLPLARIYLVSGKDNIISHILRHYGYDLNNAYVNLTSSPVKGLNGSLQVDSLVANGFEIDTVRFNVFSDESTMTYTAQLRNGKDNPQYVFNALIDGSINEHGTSLKTRVYDLHDRLGVQLGLQGSMEQNGIRVHLFGDDPIIGYKKFSVNDNNYIFMGDDRRVSANMVLQAADGMGMQIFSNDQDSTVLQDLSINLHKFNIGDALAMIPYTPNVEGILNGDFHIIQTSKEITVSSSVNVANMIYEGSTIGNIGSEFTYMPRSDGGHYVDGILLHEGNEIGVLTGTYFSQGKGVLDAKVDLERFPMDMANGFIPDRLIGFKGYAEGTLSVKGSVNSPNVNGEVFLDSTYMFSEPYGVEMRFADDPVTIKDSRLLFENFEMFAHNESPLNVQGYFDFSNMSRMNMDVRMRANNFLLIDSKETGRSDAFGKAYVNYFGTMRGLLSNLQMRGRLDVLGTTDLKYNLKDSPLSNDNQLEGLVDFVDFKDTTTQVINRPPITGLNMDLSISIDQGAHVDCFLNADKSNYIDIIGGGDMRMQYNVVDNVRLNGRYTISSGEMKYSLPVIPLKTFTVQDGSYIEFRGDPMNPRLNLTATEETQSTIGNGTNEARLVKFNCGVVVTKTLQDMGLEFIMDAPEDMTIHNQLQIMSKEERGKIAVTMLTTGMYLSEGGTRGFTMNSALSSFLNSQINQISNKALRSLDVSIGVDNSIQGSGAFHTDYSFKFAKRFWNNRLRVSIGGKLSSGVDAAMQNETFFDNITLEYRLSPTSNQYLRLFYKRNNYDWLEGNIGKYGGGFQWRRKLNSLTDIFRFKSDVTDLPAIRVDSIQKPITKEAYGSGK